MKNHNIPLAIILKKIQNGYAFQSLQEITNEKDKNKKSKLGRKPAAKGAPNRLIKEIGLSSQQLASQVTPPPQIQQISQIQEQPLEIPTIFQVNQQQELSCQIDRETELPKTPANWFDKQQINAIQKKQLKQFFSGSESKNPELYLKYRNFIVQAYEKNPKRYLSKISCRRILRGDANTIIRVHSFLQKYGIINFAVNYDGNYVFKSSALSKQYEQRTKPQSCLKSIPENDEQTAEKQVDTDNMTITVINKNFSRTYRACCSQCKLICGIAWFANITEQQSIQKNLCFQCFNKLSSKEMSDYAKVDIVKKMQAHSRDGKNYPKNAWNIQENIRLLDFMSNSKNQSWKTILDYFGGKRTIQDIVLQFLQFPISNMEIKKQKRQPQIHVEKDAIKHQIGFNSQDYKQILQDMYQNSQYSKKCKLQKEQVLQNEQINSKNYVHKDKLVDLEGISKVLDLTMQKMLSKIENLKSQEDIIESQLTKYQSLIRFKVGCRQSQSQQEKQKSTNDLETKNKAIKLQKKINQGSPFQEDLDNDIENDA